MRCAPNMLFAAETRHGRIALVFEAESTSQANRRLQWLKRQAAPVSRALATTVLAKLPRGMPLSPGVPYVSGAIFEEADID